MKTDVEQTMPLDAAAVWAEENQQASQAETARRQISIDIGCF